MGKKDFIAHPDVGSGRIGLAVAECQTLHDGHCRLFASMYADCDIAIIGLGSSDKYGVPGHPFTFEQRKTMIEGVFGAHFRIVSLQDIDATDDHDAWMNYVLDRIEGAKLPEPTDYYSGSAYDARFYDGFFPSAKGEPAFRSGPISTYLDAHYPGRALHIIDRALLASPSGREVRNLIERRDGEWRDFVPERLWRYVEQHYPPHLRNPVEADALPAEGAFPVGTKLILGGSEEVLILRDDGKWRPNHAIDDKAVAARQLHQRG